MSISTLDAALAGMQPPKFIAKQASATLTAGKWISTYSYAGSPGAGALSGSLNGSTYSSSSSIPNGIIPHVDPGSGNSYLARWTGTASQGGTLILCDRLWDNTVSTTSTSLQSITSPTWPARDNAGSTNGDGVLLAFECTTAMGAAAPTLSTFTYTNSAGTGSRAGAFTVATFNSAPAGSFFPVTLQAGDTGVRSVQSFTFSVSWSSGTVGIVAYRVLAAMETVAANVSNSVDALTSGFPQLYNGVCPFIVFVPNTTTAVNVSGTYVETQG